MIKAGIAPGNVFAFCIKLLLWDKTIFFQSCLLYRASAILGKPQWKKHTAKLCLSVTQWADLLIKLLQKPIISVWTLILYNSTLYAKIFRSFRSCAFQEDLKKKKNDENGALISHDLRSRMNNLSDRLFILWRRSCLLSVIKFECLLTLFCNNYKKRNLKIKNRNYPAT